MGASVEEWLNIIVRWAHVIAAIMWIGDSFLFMWLDRSLSKPTKPREGDVTGELWMAHSGGFYEVIKHRALGKLPPQLFWFKWESYTTWITGFLLLIIVYWIGSRGMLLDATSPLSQGAAVGISFGLLAGALLVYIALCKTPLIRQNKAFGVIGLALVVAAAWSMDQVFTPRATFLQVGAMLGTIMASNVFLVIIPAQRHMLASTEAGTPVDTSYGARAKQRSTHNHYLTLPVLALMLSNHFPTLYGHAEPWLILGLLVILGAGAKLVMLLRRETPVFAWAGTSGALVALVILTGSVGQTYTDPTLEAQAPVSFATAQAIVQARCTTCHAAAPTDPSFAAPPQGVTLETAADIATWSQRILLRAYQTQTMPLGNLTGMTDDERLLLGAWVAQGANIDAPGPVLLVATVPGAAPVMPDSFASPAEEATWIFTHRCGTCHGPQGRGDGPAAAGLDPRPTDFSHAGWQSATTDEHMIKVIVGGGQAVGKSPLMVPNPDLDGRADVLGELVRIIRAKGER